MEIALRRSAMFASQSKIQSNKDHKSYLRAAPNMALLRSAGFRGSQRYKHRAPLERRTLSGLLGLDWVVASHQPNDVPPGGALVFSLWKVSDDSYSVRVQFVSQTLDQMHNATKVTLQNPPVIVDLFVPGCSTSLEGYPCAWTSFKDLTKRVLAY